MALDFNSPKTWGALAAVAGVGVVLGMAVSKSGGKDRWTIDRVGSPDEARARGYDPKDFRTAMLSETMGPNYKPILWVGDRPFVRREGK